MERTRQALVQGLNPEQKLAVETTEGPILVLAGAGSGKTRVITHRIAYLLASGVPAERILAMTFTNKAAAEMKERIRSMIGAEAAEGLMISTFHSFGLWVVRRSADWLELPRNMQILDESDRSAFSKEIRKELKLSEQDLTIDEWNRYLMQIKGCGTPPPQVEAAMGYRKGSQARRMFELYLRRLRLAQALDFDDLILLPVQLLRGSPEVRRMYQNLFDYVMVDEYQDTNLLQFNLLKLLIDDKQNLCVVGDDDQSIYGWRGARVENILEFDKKFPKARIIKLTRNYRSRKNILDLANAVIARNEQRHNKELWTQSEDKVPTEKLAYDTDRDEALGVTRHIQALLGNKDARPDDIAILYRTKGQSRIFQETLRMEQVPYRVVGSFDFFERKEIRDFMAYIRLAVNPNDGTAFRRVLNYPSRSIGLKTLEKLDLYYKRGLPVMEAADAFLKADGDSLNVRTRRSLEVFLSTVRRYNDSFRNASGEGLVSLAQNLFGDSGMKDDLAIRSEFGLKAVSALIDLLRQGVTKGQFKNLQDFVEGMTLQQNEADFSSGDEGKGCVTLMTVHSAKGLEFDNVYLVGLVEGLFPHAMSVEESGIEEERRLFYVAITRARERLVLSRFRRREERGEMRSWKPSRFFPEMPDSLVVDGHAAGRKEASKEDILQALSLLDDLEPPRELS